MARIPHHHLVDPACQRRSSKHPGQTCFPVVKTTGSYNLTSLCMASSFSSDPQAIKHAMGTLDFRKHRNRKRSSTGEYIWPDRADFVFALALIAWTSDQTIRRGERRSIFLQQFLGTYGITKTRKQIASRLQVLKGEWSNSPYLDLLKDPDDIDDIRSRRGSSPPSLHEDQPSASHTAPHTVPPVPSRYQPDAEPKSSIINTARTRFPEDSSSSVAAPLSPVSDYSQSCESDSQQCYAQNQFSRSIPSSELSMDMARREPRSQPMARYINLPLPVPHPSAGFARSIGSGLLSLSAASHPDYTSFECSTNEQPSLNGTFDNYYPNPYPFSYQ